MPELMLFDVIAKGHFVQEPRYHEWHCFPAKPADLG